MPKADNPISSENPSVHRLLHLYMHDYCLKNNLLRTANAIVSETGIRTDEGVPVRREGEKSLLYEWFAIFWENLYEALQSNRTSKDIFSSICNRTKINCREQETNWVEESLAMDLDALQHNEMPIHPESPFRTSRPSAVGTKISHHADRSDTFDSIDSIPLVQWLNHGHLEALSKKQKKGLQPLHLHPRCI